MSPIGTLTLVRHGQASFGTADYDRLSDLGHDQARAVGRWLAEVDGPPDLLLAGGLRRHDETARDLLAGANWSQQVEIDPRWDEFDPEPVLAALPDLADVDLADRAQFQAAYVRATTRWSSGRHDGDYPDPWPMFTARVLSAATDAAAQAGPGRTVLVVSSGGPIAAVLAAALDRSHPVNPHLWGSLTETMVNTGISRLLVGRRGMSASTVNEHPHLEAPTYR